MIQPQTLCPKSILLQKNSQNIALPKEELTFRHKEGQCYQPVDKVTPSQNKNNKQICLINFFGFEDGATNPLSKKFHLKKKKFVGFQDSTVKQISTFVTKKYPKILLYLIVSFL